MVWLIVALGIALGLMIGLFHTDAPAIEAPPIAPIYQQPYGDRQ